MVSESTGRYTIGTAVGNTIEKDGDTNLSMSFSSNVKYLIN
jgi:hypothetical protein